MAFLPPHLYDLSHQEKHALLTKLEHTYKSFQEEKLHLDMTRGKPSPEQLDLSLPMLSLVNEKHYKSENHTDCRNYGILDGIPEAKRLFSWILDIPPENIFVGGNSSLNLMYDVLVQAMLYGVPGGDKPWKDEGKISFLCPVPGYDRHFAILEHLGIEMIPIRLGEEGPDMETVASLVESNPSIKGIFCVPKYSNPTGITYSEEVVKAFTKLKPAASDFRVFWDNAYAIHDIDFPGDRLLNVFEEASRHHCEERFYIFSSTSKITFAGGGIACIATGRKNLDALKKHYGIQTIGYDKLNQMRHALFFRERHSLENHMKKHADILRPKKDAVIRILTEQFANLGIVGWTNPKGGYFVSIDTLPGCAQKVVSLAHDAGVKLTPAGSPFPYKKDPKDTSIRLAFSYPSLAEIEKAMEVVSLCIALASLRSMLHSN
ncbi:MAG: aminotransferase [Brevinematales bacterium]|nr:aminotransferase [Brevinematales bacterium]